MRFLHGGRSTGDVKDEYAADCIFEVGGDEALELLLPGGVPELEAAGVALVLDVLAHEIHPDGGLSCCLPTLKKSSNRLFANF